MDKRRTKQFPTGTRPKGAGIELMFIWPKGSKERCFKTLNWSHTTTNIEKAGILRKKIIDAIKYDIFSWSDFFPDDPRSQEIHKGTFSDYAQIWLDLPTNDWKPQSRYKFKGILNRVWMPQLHDKPIDKIKYTHITTTLKIAIDDFDKKYNREPSPSIYNDWLACVRGVFDAAIKDEAIPRLLNPTAELKNKKRTKSEADPFDQEEINLIIDDIYKNDGDMWGAWFELCFYSGMRCPSEPSALTWQHIDLRKKEIKIKQIRSRHAKDGIQKTTKTGVHRTILLNSRSEHAINTLRKLTGFQDEWLFMQANGPVTTGDPQRKMWRASLKRLKIRYRDMYNMRHSYATFGLMNNANPAFMAKQLGHSLEEFFKTYATWINRVNNDTQINFIESAIKKTKCGKDAVENN